MASVPVIEIIGALADALRTITVANGYNTDLGKNVLTEPVEGLPSDLRCTVVCGQKARAENGKARPAVGRELVGAIEIDVPSNYASAMATIYKAEEDVDRCLRQYHQMPDALPVQYAEAAFLSRPDGMPVCVAQIHWTTGYRAREEA